MREIIFWFVVAICNAALSVRSVGDHPYQALFGTFAAGMAVAAALKTIHDTYLSQRSP